ncbi:hypothetical protein, partial [Streptomyces beijiangensis]
MALALSTLDATSHAIAANLGLPWKSTGADRDGSALLAYENEADPTRILHITLRPVFGGRTIALRLSCNGVHINGTTGQWTEGPYTWNTGTDLPSDDTDTDPAALIADVIRDRLLPASIRKPRHVGDECG